MRQKTRALTKPYEHKGRGRTCFEGNVHKTWVLFEHARSPKSRMLVEHAQSFRTRKAQAPTKTPL